MTVNIKKLYIFKALSLVFLLLCAQFAIAGHTHGVDVTYEVCSTCLVAEQAELDDVIPSTAKTSHSLEPQIFHIVASDISQVTNKRFRVHHLRGPPA